MNTAPGPRTLRCHAPTPPYVIRNPAVVAFGCRSEHYSFWDPHLDARRRSMCQNLCKQQLLWNNYISAIEGYMQDQVDILYEKNNIFLKANIAIETLRITQSDHIKC